MYFKFTEQNDWEGETWHFFIPYVYEQALRFERLIKNIAPDSESFEVNITKLYTPQEVDLLVEEGETGYMRQFNKCGPLKLNAMIDANLTEDDLYKGAIENWCEKAIS